MSTPTITNVQPAARSEGPDRHGHTYAQLLKIQAKHLEWWEALLQPAHFAKLKAFCDKKNKPAIPGAKWPDGLHTVPRGVELHLFLVERAMFILGDEEDLNWLTDQIPPSKKD